MKLRLPIALFFILLSSSIFPFGGSIPAGLPTTFGFGAIDKWDNQGGDTPTQWKVGQGTTCWDYNYQYLTSGWETWQSPAGQWATSELTEWQSQGQETLFTYYYNNGSTSMLTNTSTMTTWFNDLIILFKLINTNTSSGKVTIVHIEPDLLGFCETGGMTSSSTVEVAATGISDLSGIPNTLAGWWQAIITLRNKYAPGKALVAIHYSCWADDDVFNSTSISSISQLDTDVDTVSTFLKNVMGSYPADLIAAESSDRDADWYAYASNDTTRWANMDFTDPPTLPGQKTWGRIAYIVDRVSSNLGLRVIMWQIPVGNTYFKTCDNDETSFTCSAGTGIGGHFRDNASQAFIPSTSNNGSSGSPGDAYSASSTTTGPGYWAAHGVIAVFFGEGAYNWLPSGSAHSNVSPTHLRDWGPTDNTTNPTSSTFNTTGNVTADVWGQATSAYADNDGGYIRLAVAKYCSTGKYSLTGSQSTPTYTPTSGPSPTRTPTFTITPTATNTPFICSKMIYTGDAAGLNLAAGTVTNNSPATMTETTGGNPGNCMTLNYVLPAATPYWQPLLWTLSTPVQISDNTDLRLDVKTTSGTAPKFIIVIDWGSTIYQIDVNSYITGGINGTWQTADIPLSALKASTTTSITFIDFIDGNNTAYTVLVDNIRLTGGACPSATPTITNTLPATNTFTQSPTASYSKTNTPTFTFTYTPTASSTITLTNTPVNTSTYTITNTIVNTATPTWTSTLLPTATKTATATMTSTSTAQNTATMTSTGTFTPLPSSTKTSTVSFTVTMTLTSTTQNTATPTSTGTNSPLPTTTRTSTLTNTSTSTVTSTLSNTPTNTTTWTSTSLPTKTSTLLPTNTVTGSPTTTDTPVVSATPTSTNIVLTWTITPTYTISPTITTTDTELPTATQTNTGTFTAIPTDTRTNTSTFTAVPTSTYTPVNTFTVTAINTVTSTTTDTRTTTNTPTLTWTQTDTPMPTRTNTLLPTDTISETPTSTNSPIVSATPTFTNIILSWTITQTFTITSTITITNTPLNTSTETPQDTATLTDTPMPTLTYSPIPSMTDTSVNTPSFTATETLINTITLTFTKTNTPLPTLTNTPQNTAIPTSTPTIGASLVAVITLSTYSAIIGEEVTVVMQVGDTGTNGVNNLQPSVLTIAGGNAILVSGPSPSNAAISGGSLATFTWIYSITSSTGSMTFNGSSNGLDTINGVVVTSQTVTSGVLTCATATPTVNLTLTYPTVTPSFTVTVSASTPTRVTITKIYPNPAKDKFKYEFLLGEDSDVKICIYTVAYRLIFKLDQQLSAGLQIIDIGTNNMANGAYYIVCKRKGQSGTSTNIDKLIVLK